jgi:hypothetical protein
MIKKKRVCFKFNLPKRGCLKFDLGSKVSKSLIVFLAISNWVCKSSNVILSKVLTDFGAFPTPRGIFFLK